MVNKGNLLDTFFIKTSAFTLAPPTLNQIPPNAWQFFSELAMGRDPLICSRQQEAKL